MSQVDPFTFDPSDARDIFDDADPETDARRAVLAEADVAAGRLAPVAPILNGYKGAHA